MSEIAPSEGEWKTIRISAPAYHKLLQLSSFMTLISLARTIPISVVAELAITTFYDREHPRFKEALSDPKTHQVVGKEIALGLKKVYDSRDEWKAVLKEQEERR